MAQQNPEVPVVNAGEEEVQAMEVDPPIQQAAIILQMQHTIEQLRQQMNQQLNQQLLGVQPQVIVPQEEAPPPELPDDGERRRLDSLLKILRSIPKFQGGSHEPFRAFKLRFSTWRTITQLDRYATERNKKLALLNSMEGQASRAMELYGVGSAAFETSATLDDYLVYIKNVFSPAAERDCARAAFKQRVQKNTEPPSVYFSEKMSLYLQTLQGAPFDYEQFREELYMGLRNKWLRTKMIESRAVNDRELLQDLM